MTTEGVKDLEPKKVATVEDVARVIAQTQGQLEKNIGMLYQTGRQKKYADYKKALDAILDFSRGISSTFLEYLQDPVKTREKVALLIEQMEPKKDE